MDFVLLYIGIIIILILGSMIVTLQNKITRLNITVDKIAKQIGVVEITEDMASELKNLILMGKKNQAIKKYRIATGYNLKESSDHIEKLSKDN